MILNHIPRTIYDWAVGLFATKNSPTFAGPVTITALTTYGSNESPNTTIFTSPSSSSGDYNLGYAFTPNINGQVTALSAYTGGTGSYTIRLYDNAGTVIASVVITGVVATWVTGSITPVSLTSGSTYTVAIRTTGTFYYKPGISVPDTIGSITIIDGKYDPATNAKPTTSGGGTVYEADIVFQAATSVSLNLAGLQSFAGNAAAVAVLGSGGAAYRNGDNIGITH